jgi:hypothetical protein
MIKIAFFRAVSRRINGLGRFCLIESPLKAPRSLSQPAFGYLRLVGELEAADTLAD